MKKNVSIIALIIALTTSLYYNFGYWAFYEEARESVANMGTSHILAGAFEASMVRSGDVKSYFQLMEMTFEVYPSIYEDTVSDHTNMVLVDNAKKEIARYYVLSDLQPTQTLQAFLGEHLNNDYEPRGVELIEERSKFLELIEENRKAMDIE